MWFSNWPIVQRFMAAATWWIKGPNGHLQQIDYVNLRSRWDAEGEVVSAETWRALNPMFEEMKRVTNAWVTAGIEKAQS